MVKMTKAEYKAELIGRSADGLFPCRDDHGCRYRYDGKMCGAGVLIPDKLYNHNLENKSIMDLFTNNELPIDIVPDGMTILDIQLIQQAHDSLANGWDHEAFVKRVNEIIR